MLPFAILLAVVAVLTVEGPLAGAWIDAALRGPVAVGGLVLLAGLAVAGATLIAGHIRGAETKEELALWIRRYDRLQTLHFALWSGYVALLVLGGWTSLVREGWGLGGVPVVDDLVILLPILAPPLLAWAAWHEVELALETRLGPLGRSLPRTRLGYVLEQVRGPIAIALGPLLVLVVTYDAARWWLGDTLMQSYGGLIGAPVVLAAAVALPAWVGQLWDLSPLPPGRLRTRLAERAERMRTPISEIYLWRAEAGVANAAVLGFFPWQRHVLLSEELLARLSDAEVEAVFAHELAHLARGHLWLRLAAVSVPLAIVMAAGQVLTPWLGDGWAALLLPIAALAGAVAATGWTSWWVEFDADDAACRTEDGQPDAARAADLHRALTTLVPNARQRAGGSWLHPSLDARLAALAQLAASAPAPSVEACSSL